MIMMMVKMIVKMMMIVGKMMRKKGRKKCCQLQCRLMKSSHRFLLAGYYTFERLLHCHHFV